MRAANIPVRHFDICGHGVPVFWTIGHTLGHGDDVYDAKWIKVTPAFPVNLILVPNATFNFWFLSSEGSCQNVSRRPLDIWLQLLPKELVELYCQDVANGLGHADGAVYDCFRRRVQSRVA